MDNSKNSGEGSDDPVQLGSSSPDSKVDNNAEDSKNVSSEKSDNNRSDDNQEELKDSTQRRISSSSVVDTLTDEKDKNVEEISRDTLETNDDESNKKIGASNLETNNTSKTISSNTTEVGEDEKQTALPVTEIKEAKRKRRTPSDQRDEQSTDETEARVKRAKTKSTNDNFCWRCHKESVDARCSACPRSWHRKCMGGAPPTSTDETWICGECATILRAENAETRSEVVAHLSIDHLCMLLKYIVERMRSCQGSEPFWKAVDISEVPNYMDYVVRPMDLNLLESNVRAKLYGSTDAFMADAKWIQHNCIVFNTCGGVYADTSKLTNAAKQIIKTAKQEVAEIEACPDCYVRGRNLPRPHPSWFIEPCRKPHPLIWAKLKGFPFWPAKAMPRVNGQGHVDVRFFGQHDRAWVPPKDLYLYSREPPSPLPRKRKVEMAECIKEITRHCKKLEVAFGPFQFAPAKTPYNPQDPNQIKVMLPQYDPLRPNEHIPTSSIARRKSPFRKRNAPVKRKLEADSTITETAAESANNSVVADANAPVVDNEKPEKAEENIPAPAVVTETAKPKKRAKKSLNNSEARNTTQDKVSSSPSPVAETTSTSTPNDTPNKVNTTVNGTPEVKSTPPTKGLNQSRGKSEKTVIPLEKSLAGLLRSVNAKGRLSHPRNSSSKNTISHSTPNGGKTDSKNTSIKVYKPKARMVDKVNAEKALKSTNEKEQASKTMESEPPKTPDSKVVNGILTPVTAVPTISLKNPPPSGVSGTISLLHNKRDNNIIISNSLLKSTPKKLQPRILVVNNGTMETKQILSPSDDAKSKTEPIAVKVKQEPNVSPQTPGSAQKKQSRAKKSFPNKPPRLPQLLPKLPKPPASNLDTMVYIPTHRNENGSEYQLPPPEAGPLSAQLHRGANELAKRLGQLMEEAIKQAADSSLNETGNSVDSHQATIHSLRLQIERMRWQHQQQLSELKHNTDRTLREMRASLEAERLRAIGDVRKEAAEEKKRCIDEVKSKQWCAQCRQEAFFYCCWNTAYCDHLCQQSHWQTHQRKCAQKQSGVSSESGNQQQVMPNLVGGPRVNWCKSAESKPHEGRIERLERGPKTIVIYTADD